MNILTQSTTVHDKASGIQFLQQKGILHDTKNRVNSHELGLGKDATIDFNNYLLEVCAADHKNPMLIGGPSMTVEIDESLFSQ